MQRLQSFLMSNRACISSTIRTVSSLNVNLEEISRKLRVDRLVGSTADGTQKAPLTQPYGPTLSSAMDSLRPAFPSSQECSVKESLKASAPSRNSDLRSPLATTKAERQTPPLNITQLIFLQLANQDEWSTLSLMKMNNESLEVQEAEVQAR